MWQVRNKYFCDSLIYSLHDDSTDSFILHLNHSKYPIYYSYQHYTHCTIFFIPFEILSTQNVNFLYHHYYTDLLLYSSLSLSPLPCYLHFSLSHSPSILILLFQHSFFPQNQFQVSFLIHCFSHKKSLFFLFLLEPQLSFLIIFIHCVFFFSFDYFSFIPISFDTLSISIMSISDLAQSFVKFYYDTFDSNPQQLAGVYVFSLIFSYSILLSLARWLHAHFRGWRVPRYSEHHQQVCCIFYFSQFIHS